MNWKLDDNNTAKYLDLCRNAVEYEEVFDNFRRMDPMTMIVENSPEKSGLEYYECIKNNYPWLFENFTYFMSSDKIGQPLMYQIGPYHISPTTLRYIKTAGDLYKHFGSLSGMTIAEIGGGYGGLCKIIHDTYNRPQHYAVYDLPEVQALQNKFLRKFDVPCRFADLRFEAPEIDLLIAMYSWSELSEDMQVEYLNKVIKKSKNCYIMLNYDMDYSYRLLKEAFPKAKIKDYNIFYDEQNTEYAPYNRFVIIKN